MHNSGVSIRREEGGLTRMLETQDIHPTSPSLVPEISAEVRSKAERVLIVDDEPIIRDILKSLVLKDIRGVSPRTARKPSTASHPPITKLYLPMFACLP